MARWNTVRKTCAITGVSGANAATSIGATAAMIAATGVATGEMAVGRRWKTGSGR
jgi:hypothetical protein